MNREIKFRIWNGIEMVYDITVGRFGVFYVNPENGDGLNPQDTASLTENTTKYHEGTPLMQFTGLKDKNGVEIYEDDTIKYYHPYHKRFITEIVKWDSLFACFALFQKYDDEWAKEFDWVKIEEVEVTGSIHDSPKLLTKY